MKPKNIFRPLLATVAGLALATASHGAAVIYEGFDYDTGGLNGRNGGTGFDGAWTAGGNTQVVSGSLGYSSLETTGNSFSGSPNINRFGGTRAISATALSGLLDDGDVLWFSVMLGLAPGTNGTNHDLALALATDGFVTENGGRTNLTAGEGIGVYLKSGLARAAVYNTSTVATVASTGTAYDPVDGGSGLTVGKITWGATDTIEIFQPGTDLSLGSAVSTTTGTIDQSALDTLTFRWKDPVLMDEIRFGASYEDVRPIPEPSAALLAGVGALALLRRRR